MSDEPAPLVDQPTAAPTRKQAANGIAGAVSTVAMYVYWRVTGEQLPPGMESALTAIFVFFIGYAVRNRANPADPKGNAK